MLRVKGLVKLFRSHDGSLVRAVNNVSFSILEGKLFTLLGPSGCGKTTILRCVAGLETPDDGEITIGGRVVFSRERHIMLPPQNRDIGMVFQSYAIWPHMSVFENVAFPLRVSRRRPPEKEIRHRVMDTLERVQLQHLAGRDATRLSGGQQQRLALARALVREPQLLLLDEPLSNLDAKLRAHMRFELKRLQRDLGITTLYVTHDQAEALALANIIAVMKDGEVQQIGTPREIYDRPANHFVADFIGSTNFLEGELVMDAAPDQPTEVNTAVGVIRCVTYQPLPAGTRVLVSIRPEQVAVSHAPPGMENAFPALVETWVYIGDCTEVQLRIGDVEVRARVHPEVQVTRHSRVWVSFPVQRCVIVGLTGTEGTEPSHAPGDRYGVQAEATA